MRFMVYFNSIRLSNKQIVGHGLLKATNLRKHYQRKYRKLFLSHCVRDFFIAK